LTVSVPIVNGHINQWPHDKCSSFIGSVKLLNNMSRLGTNFIHSFLPPPLNIFLSKEIKTTVGNCICTHIQFGMFF